MPFGEPLPDSLRIIVDRIRTLIESEQVTKQAIHGGWRHLGGPLEAELQRIVGIISQSGNTVWDCHTVHFTRGARIHNTTKQLVLIGIRGTFKPEAQGFLLQGSFEVLEGDLVGFADDDDGVDLGIVVLAEGTAFNKVQA
ncbi:hypothetical protein BJY04DRAFT_189746 [Aspergillus karnatakaensis]|uniref:uncharacterized protein n=1 Tax=Aspergillus karnatakaensis TaxID=1810916 RepID=UPI003CCD9AC9